MSLAVTATKLSSPSFESFDQHGVPLQLTIPYKSVNWTVTNFDRICGLDRTANRS